MKKIFVFAVLAFALTVGTVAVVTVHPRRSLSVRLTVTDLAELRSSSAAPE